MVGFGIWDLGFGIWDLGFGIWDLGFGIGGGHFRSALFRRGLPLLTRILFSDVSSDCMSAKGHALFASQIFLSVSFPCVRSVPWLI